MTTTSQRARDQLDVFNHAPFDEAGGLGRAAQVLDDDLGPPLDELDEVLAA